eukprot:12200790-Alexandrium_andersonii.AAC.1
MKLHGCLNGGASEPESWRIRGGAWADPYGGHSRAWSPPGRPWQTLVPQLRSGSESKQIPGGT